MRAWRSSPPETPQIVKRFSTTTSNEDNMPGEKRGVYPYIPNADPAVKAEMLRAVGAQSIEDLFAEIPARLRFQGRLNLPESLPAEADLVRHVEGLLARNTSTREVISFLGAGCYQHHVPAVCDEINGRGEFLTAYAGEPYEDHGRFQAMFEYQSMMGELLNMDVVNVPTYDSFQAAATALRMAGRVTGRTEVILCGTLGRDKLSKIRDYLKPDMTVEMIPWHEHTGEMYLPTLRKIISSATAAVFFELPGYLGFIETQAETIAAAAHASGALCVCHVNPIALGVLTPPADLGADIVCGDIQPLGIHMQYGGGLGGFIASHDDPKIVMEYPSRLYGLAPTSVKGAYGFGDVAFERTSFAQREQSKEFVGTAAGLWGITAGVYLALMGPQGIREIGQRIMQRTRYAMNLLGRIPGVRLPFAEAPHFNEFVVSFASSGKSVDEINAALRQRGIFGGKDLSSEFPGLSQSSLFCISELHTQQHIHHLVDALAEILQ
jgi:glycine dehydrogenase subunit 1